MSDDTELRMYCLMRGDLEAPDGKLMVQSGHAFVNALEAARTGKWVQPNVSASSRQLMGNAIVREYLEFSQPKIVLKAKNEAALRRAADECQQAGIAHYLVTDEGRTVFLEPTVTCLGIGPVLKSNLSKFIQRMQKW